MISKTKLSALVKEFKWKEVDRALAERPELLSVVDERARNWLHLCCGVNPKRAKLSSQDSVKTAEVLLRRGLDINKEAFSEGDWKATPLWYAIARGISSCARIESELLPLGGGLRREYRSDQAAGRPWR